MASGPIESVNLDGRRFTLDAEVDAAIAFGGSINEAKPNGDGTARLIKSKKLARVNSLPLVMDDDRGDEEYIQELIDSNEFFTVGVTKVDGSVYSGSMQIVEDPETSTKEGTKEISLMGTLRKQ